MVVRWTLGVAIGLGLAAPAGGQEPFREFLDGLRRRQLFDTALDYLDQARTNPLVIEADRTAILYEEGRCLVEGARTLRDVNKRLGQLDAARIKFDLFLKESPDHPLAAAAGIQLGQVLVERGKTVLERAAQPGAESEATALRDEARGLFAQAAGVFAGAEQKFQERYDSFPTVIDSKHPEQLEARRLAQVDLIQARLFSAQLLYEWAQSYPRDDPEFAAKLKQAGEKFAALYQDYRRLMAGLVARMWQARCLQESGNTKQALAYYAELLDQPDEQPEFRQLKSQALRLAMACWLEPGLLKLEEAVRRAREWLEQAEPELEQSPEGTAIRWHLARALHQQALALGENAPARENLLREATRAAEFVARIPGDHQREAKALVAALRGVEEGAAPENFADAREQAKAALDEMEALLRRLQLAGTEPEGDERQALEEQASGARQRALDLFRRALELRTDETPLEEVNQVRYFLGYLLLKSGRYYDAAVAGEFLARNYPDGVSGRPGAAIAVSGYVQAYNQALLNERQTEIDQLVSLAQYVAEKWPSDPEGDQAWAILADMALRDQDYGTAIGYLDRIAENSPRRAEALLKSGQALWSRYLAASRQAETNGAATASGTPSAATGATDAAEAQTRLEQGLKLSPPQPGSPPSPLVATAELTLAQILNANSQFPQAVALLDRPETGPLALVAARSPLAERGNFTLETYKAALAAFVGAQQLDRATAIMQALETWAAERGEGAGQLTRIYVSLGRDLEEQIARLRQQGKTEALAAVVASFETFLDQIAARDEGNTFQSLNWVAETYAGLGQGLAGSGPAPPEARAYFERAAKVYTRLRERSRQESGFAPAGDVDTGLAVRLARCDRRLENYAEAIELLVGVLKKKPATLDAQVEAATCYQAWGAQDPAQFTAAIHGARPARKPDGTVVNIVWGWKKLAATVQGNPQFRELFHESYYQLARTAYQQGMAGQGAERERSLTSAVVLIEQLARTDPSLGGPAERARYDALLRELERTLNRPVRGLDGVAATNAAPAG